MSDKTKTFLMIVGGFLIVITSIGILVSIGDARVTRKLEAGYCQEQTGFGSVVWTQCGGK